MQHKTSPHRPWQLYWRGSLHVVQGWLMGDRQRVLQGRYERLLAEIDQVQRRASAHRPAVPLDAAAVVGPSQQLA